MKDGFLKVCAATPSIAVADCQKNGEVILQQIREAANNGVKVIVFPELCITGATCGDLFRNTVLLQGAMDTLHHLAAETAELNIVCAVGLPVRSGSQVLNCCAIFYHGKIHSLVPKKQLSPAEQRVFSVPQQDERCLSYPVERNPVFSIASMENVSFCVEIGAEAEQPIPPSAKLTAESCVLLVLHPDAAPETVATAERRAAFHAVHSRNLCCAYITAAAGSGESTTDQVYGGHRLIAENGKLLAEGTLFSTGLTISEIDFDYLQNKRMQRNFPAPTQENNTVTERFSFPLEATTLTRPITPSPFLPMADKAEAAARIERILDLQCAGLGKRLTHTHCKTAVVGLSGGLDSTLALLVTARTFDQLGLDRSQILAITMPCFGTTRRTKSNAQRLAESLGVSFREIPIDQAVRQHFADIGQSMEQQDVTFENGQARERTQVLMDVANQLGGMVIGTGDLSELALGWATYNGDHMSMYGINGSIPKTLMRHIVTHLAQTGETALQSVLTDILDTPVSPELLPAKDGEIAQKTEELVGPYELHDFFLYHALGNGFSPTKIERLANIAFDGVYSPGTIHKWLQNFYRRFFQQQFKRSCLPDGPAVGSISLSPRGGLILPSDASGILWQDALSKA